MLKDCGLGLIFLVLGLVALLARIRFSRDSRWMDGLVLLVVLGNLMVIGRQIQPALSDGIYAAEPELVRKRIADAGNQPIHSRYAPLQQVLYGIRDEGIFRWAKSVGMGDNWLPFGVAQAYQGGMKLDRNEAAVARIFSGSEEEGNLMADVLGIRYVLTGTKLSDVLFRHAPREFGLLERPSCLPRAFLVGRWKEGLHPDEILKQLLAPSVVAGQEALIETVTTGYQLPQSYSLPQPQADTDAAVATHSTKWVTDQANRVVLEVQAGQRSLLVLNHSWYPGWTAKVDGQAAPVFRVNYLFRGVFLEAGRHTVEFDYQPRWLRLGIGGSVFAGLILFLLWFRFWGSRRATAVLC